MVLAVALVAKAVVRGGAMITVVVIVIGMIAIVY